MNTEHDHSEPLRLPAPETCPIPSHSASSVVVRLPDPSTDLEGWIEASLLALETRFQAFVTADSLERSTRPTRRRRSER